MKIFDVFKKFTKYIKKFLKVSFFQLVLRNGWYKYIIAKTKSHKIKSFF